MLLVSITSSDLALADVVARKFSPYEQETIELVLADVGGTLEPAPDGKLIEKIHIVPLEVFEQRDPAPAFLNWFHVTTQKAIIEREVLLRVGAPYDPLLAAETERNLRGFVQLSVVLLVPIKGSTPDKVRLLVITKDVWSLRVSWQPAFVNGKLTALTLAPAESNLFGTTQTVAGLLYLDSNNYWLGARYYVPRIGGSRIRGYVSANGIFNCATNELEGATGDLTYGQPLYSSLTRWSWQTSMAWSSSVVRGLVADEAQAVCGGGVPSRLRYATTEVERERTWSREVRHTPSDSSPSSGVTVTPRPSPVGVDVEGGARWPERWPTLWRQDQLSFPYQYRYERLRGQFVLTRSFGHAEKVNLSTGVELDHRSSVREAVPPEEVAYERVLFEQQPDNRLRRVDAIPLPHDEALFAAAERAYLDPASLRPRDRRISPYGQVHTFSNSYARVINYETLGLQEDVQLGHDVYLRLYPAFQPLSTRDMLGVFASAAYTTSYRGGVARALASTTIEYAGARKSDAAVRGALHAATPDVGVGRFVYDLGFVHQPAQYLSGVYGLGGTGRLRGYLPAKLVGPGLFTFNHEFRSRPLRLFSVLTGLAVFHDVGTTFDDQFEGFRLRQGVGAGLRILFPQLDRDVFRIDFGFPIVPPGDEDPAAEFTIVASFYQAFSTPAAYPSVLLPQ